MGPGARGRDAASSTQGQRSPEAVHSGVPRGSGPPKADVSAHQAFLPVSSGLLLGQQGAGWQGGWWGHRQPQAAPGSGRGATGVGGGHLARPGKTPRPSPTGPTAPQEHTLLPGLPALQFFPLPRASRNLPGSFPHTWALVGVSQGRLLLLAGPYQTHVRLESDVDGTPVSRAGDSSRDR